MLQERHFRGRSYTLEQAEAVAESQSDLGGVTKKQLIVALTEGSATTRLYAYEALDRFSQFLVERLLEDDNMNDTITTLRYTIHNLKEVEKSLQPFYDAV